MTETAKVLPEFIFSVYNTEGPGCVPALNADSAWFHRRHASAAAAEDVHVGTVESTVTVPP